MLKNKRILITGATGFIGANLTRYLLAKGANIIILTHKTSNRWRVRDILKNVKEYNVDLLDENKLNKIIKMNKPEVIIHTAVYGGYPSQTIKKKIIETNIMGTINLVDICRNIGFELFINTGSSSEYGIRSSAIKEDDPLVPVTDYGVSKAASTLYCQMVAKRQNLPIVTLRLFSPYGYYEEPKRLIPSVIIYCLKGKNIKVSIPNPVRDFIFIEDVVNAYLKVIEKKDKVRGEIFNIGYGKQYSVAEVINKVIKLTNNKISPRWGSVPNPRNEPDFWQANISKAKRLLCWQPRHNLEQGLIKTISWFRANMNLYER